MCHLSRELKHLTHKCILLETAINGNEISETVDGQLWNDIRSVMKHSMQWSCHYDSFTVLIKKMLTSYQTLQVSIAPASFSCNVKMNKVLHRIYMWYIACVLAGATGGDMSAAMLMW